MRCESCPACYLPSGDCCEEACLLGEEEREFTDGSIGCSRRSEVKIKKDIESIAEHFAHDCSKFVEFIKSEEGK